MARLIRAWYIDPITGNPLTPDKEVDMARGTVKGMVEALADPDSHFLDPTEKRLQDDASVGKFHGIGAILALRTQTKDGQQNLKIVVLAPMTGSSAEAAGLKPGDVITHIGGKTESSH